MTERDKACLTKLRYSSARAAEAVSARMRSQGFRHAHIYRCPWSIPGQSHWHVTKRPFLPERDKGKPARRK